MPNSNSSSAASTVSNDNNVNWQAHFIYVNRPRQKVHIALCRYCGKDVARPNYGSSGMKDHLTRRHPQALEMEQPDNTPEDPDNSPLLHHMPIIRDPAPRDVLSKKYAVRAIVNHRWNVSKGWRGRGQMEYEVSWAGYKAKDNTWEPFDHFETAMEKLLEYIRLNPLEL